MGSGARGGALPRLLLLLALAALPGAAPASERPRSAAEAWVGGRQGPHQAPGTGGSWQHPPGDAPGVEGNPVPAAAPEAKASRQQAPADLGLPEAAHPVPRGPAEISGAGNSSRPCPGCAEGTGDPGARPPQPLSARDNEEALEASAAVTSVAWPADGEAIVLDLNATKGALESTAPAPESPEEPGSGDPAGRASAPTQRPTTGTTRPSTTPGLSSDSAETDLLLEAAGDAGPGSPPPGARTPGLAPGSAQKEESLELWLELASSSPAQGALGHTDVTWLPTEALPSATDAPAGLKTPEPPSEQTASEIIDIDYYDLFDGDSHGGAEGLDDFAAGGPGAAKKPGDKASSWSLHELYDDFTPFDESDFYPTTSFYTDGDEEGEDDELDEPEEDEEEDEEEDGGAGLARDLEDENGRAAPTPAVPKTLAAEPTSRRFVVPPLQTFVVAGPGATARPHPSKDLSPASVAGENGTECRSGYVRHNNSCKSVCDIFPSYCHNGGQCYLVESLGAFCRCNTQDYIWHKGMRCESIITDFQVMCVAVGSAALVVLLLFMMTVFFAKKLYLLKTENNKLRKTKYRTPSELHNDNFSLSTIAEGSHPNDDPAAPHKLQESLKPCTKEEESFNIQNSTSPKHDSGKGEPDEAEVNCLQNNLT
ncbi:chondroitin sulfate proteoglycan 5 [Alligator mississippiensis]|uniref:chondroitin sulfate proteoglycan 5 n=1 Tax=Alligator mississippiensis TaxID=8496 RepID=UPI00287749CA|nr:chondroitin sulfate proteoglycan 5 [Alligator mississippiensis]